MGHIAEYLVTAIINRDKLIQYELECQSCEHGFKCKVLVKKVRKANKYEFLCMVNDEEEEWKAWHTDFGKEKELYYPVLIEARKAVYQSAISSKKSDIEEHKNIADRLSKELEELEGHYQNIIKTEEETLKRLKHLLVPPKT